MNTDVLDMSIGGDGELWACGRNGAIYRRDETLGWRDVNGSARAISVGQRGTVIILSPSDAVYAWQAGSGTWELQEDVLPVAACA